MTDDRRDSDAQAEDDELTRIVDALEEAGFVETYQRTDGTVAVRLTARGEELRQALPEVATEPDDG